MLLSNSEEGKDMNTQQPPSSSSSPPPIGFIDTKMAEVAVTSSSSLCFGRLSFQIILIFAVSRLFIYIFKLFEDGISVKEYYNSNDTNFALISAACLAIPPLFYAIYLIGEHLTRTNTPDSNEIGTKLINGLLLFPWQIKRHLDVLHFAAQRVCQWRSPNNFEKSNFQSLKRTAETLEFFEDLYAGFLQILLQTYLLILATITTETEKSSGKIFRPSNLVASALCIFSMLIAVRRRDDGKLTAFLSIVGWSALFVSRVLAFSLGTIVLHSWISLFALVHIIGITWWVYSIAIESHKIIEPEQQQQQQPQLSNNSESPQIPDRENKCPSAPAPGGDFTSLGDHSATGIKRKHSFTALLVFLFFGIPSLLIWPMMFQLRQKKRPYIFLGLIALENIILLTIWYFASYTAMKIQTEKTITFNLAFICSITTLTGVIMLMLYACCKPKLTDQVVLHNIREQRAYENNGEVYHGQTTRSINATQYGVYYEFCDLVFRLPSTHRIAAGLKEIEPITNPNYA